MVAALGQRSETMRYREPTLRCQDCERTVSEELAAALGADTRGFARIRE
jgi:hypothetical protein